MPSEAFAERPDRQGMYSESNILVRRKGVPCFRFSEHLSKNTEKGRTQCSPKPSKQTNGGPAIAKSHLTSSVFSQCPSAVTSLGLVIHCEVLCHQKLSPILAKIEFAGGQLWRDSKSPRILQVRIMHGCVAGQA
jgi:hypothetical protein